MPRSRTKARSLQLGGLAAVAVAFAALAAWAYLAFTSAPPDPLSQELRVQAVRLDTWGAVAEAQVAIAAVRADLEGERADDRLDRRVTQLREHLEAALAEGPGQERWSELESAFDELREQVRLGDPATGDTVATIDETLREIRP